MRRSIQADHEMGQEGCFQAVLRQGLPTIQQLLKSLPGPAPVAESGRVQTDNSPYESALLSFKSYR